MPRPREGFAGIKISGIGGTPFLDDACKQQQQHKGPAVRRKRLRHAPAIKAGRDLKPGDINLDMERCAFVGKTYPAPCCPGVAATCQQVGVERGSGEGRSESSGWAAVVESVRGSSLPLSECVHWEGRVRKALTA